jgi:hypothetical protein
MISNITHVRGRRLPGNIPVSTAMTRPSNTNSECFSNSANATARMVVAMEREGKKTTGKTKDARLIITKQSTFVPLLTIINSPYA